MRRLSLVRGIIVLVVFAALLVALVVGTDRRLVAAAPPNGDEQAGVLVTDDELCAFRAPLALTGSGEVPAVCDEIIAWLRRVVTDEPACARIWNETGAAPACALRYR